MMMSQRGPLSCRLDHLVEFDRMQLDFGKRRSNQGPLQATLHYALLANLPLDMSLTLLVITIP